MGEMKSVSNRVEKSRLICRRCGQFSVRAWVVDGVGKTNLVRSCELVDVQFSISAILILRHLFVTLHKL